ncbi:T9SS type A sorting domain-containing protein [bacterium]|nr:T9SS type A sorting domain-containing protein [bacterium]
MKFQESFYKFFLLAALLVPGSLHADEWGIAVIKTDGSKQQVKFSDIERIDIGQNSLSVRTLSNGHSDYAYAGLNRIDIGVAVSSDSLSVEQLTAHGSIAVWPIPTKESVHVSGAPVGTRISVYNSVGRTVATAVTSGNTQSFNLSELPAGMYIVRVGKHSIKIVKQ